ncbi:MAG: cation-translocating P-type ATPase, partial [Ruminococcus sp.]
MAGLTEREVQARLRTEGENSLAEEKPAGIMKIFLGQFRDFMVMILLAGAVIAALLGEITDAVTIILIVLLNAILGFVQEYRTERTLEALKNMTAPQADVFRDGEWKRVPARFLVCGDLIRMEAGDNVPADCAVTVSNGLAVQESVLTGESEPVEKVAVSPMPTSNQLHHKGVVYAGTGVLKGNGEGIVIATGINTQMGKISESLTDIDDAMTPLQKRLAGLGKVVGILCIGVCIVVFLTGVLRGAPVFDMLMTGITIAIAAIPEGLPATVTIALALAVSRMRQHNALVNRLHSVETLGCANVICSDKTGTITENKMTVTEINIGGESYRVTEKAVNPGTEHINAGGNNALSELLYCGILCSTATETNGDPTETAIIRAAAKAGLNAEMIRGKYPAISIDPFDSDKKYMKVRVRRNNSEMVYVKGAADVLIKMCGKCIKDGSSVPLTAEMHREIEFSVKQMSSKALRVLGFAYGESEDDLVFAGLCGMEDPPRDAAKAAIRICSHARIRTVMITGDHPETASAIAKKAGIMRASHVLTGEQIDKMSDSELAQDADRYGVFARVSPAHKLRLVRAFQAGGNVVAMTGDGVNDAPAIKAADVGVAMGKCGTDVARQAADVVLLDDNFETLVSAVEQGRCVYSNIRKFVRYLLSCNIGEVASMF